jgi:hypothetical protein
MYTRNPCNFWSKSKESVDFLYIYFIIFKFPYNFCGDFRRTCNPRDKYMYFTVYVLQHGDPRTFYGGKICSVGTCVAILWRHDQKFSLEMDLWKTARLLLFDWIHESFSLFCNWYLLYRTATDLSLMQFHL